MRVAIIGSRQFGQFTGGGFGVVQSWVCRLARRHPGCTVVSGGAAGVDSWAVQVAACAGLSVDVLAADWARFGRGAGIVRNRQLVASLRPGLDGDVLVAFWDGSSAGTGYTIALAQAVGIRVFVYDAAGSLVPTPAPAAPSAAVQHGLFAQSVGA